MAVIPRFTSRARAPGPIPGAIETAQATGRGVQQIGRQISELGEVLFRRQKALNEEKNRTELAKFDADLQAKRTELLLQAQDEGAPDGLTERTLQEYNDFIEERSRGLKDLPDIGNRVSLYAESHRKAFEPRLLGIENKRLEAVADGNLNEALTTLELTAFRDPGSVEGIKARGWEAIEDRADAAGIAPEAVLDHQAAFTARAYTAAVRGLIGQNPPRALAELEAGKYDEFLRDADIIRKLTGEAEQAVRVQEAEHRRAMAATRNRFKSLMRDDLASLESTGVGVPNIEAQAADLLDGDEYDAFLTQRELAQEQHARFKEMEFASTEDIVGILNHAAPEPGTEGFADELRRFEQSRAAASRILKERAGDPAGYAMKAPEIAEGFRIAQEQESPELLRQAVGASLEFQAEMGIEPRVLSNAQADGLAARINDAPATERPGLMAGLRETYGPYFDHAMKELAADKKVDGLTALLPDYAGDPVVGQRLAGAIETDVKELKQGLSSVEIKDMNAAIDLGLQPFQQAFEAVPTPAARRQMNDLREAAKLYALSLFRQTGDASGAGERAIEDLIGKNFEILDTSRISAYMPLFVGNERINPADVEDAAESLIARERIEAFDPAPVTTQPLDAGSVLGRTTEGRPIIVNQEGGLSTEFTATVPDPRNPSKWINIPTIYGGQFRSDDEALSIIVGNNFVDPETGREITSYSDREAAETAAQERTKSLDSDPNIQAAFRALAEKDIARERTIATAVNSGVWITNSTADGLVLMLPLVDGSLLPLMDNDGNMFEMKFVDAARIKMSLPPPRTPESDIERGREQGAELENRRFEEMRRRAREAAQ